MSALFLLIGISLILAIGFLIAFIWSVKKGQYEDEYTPSIRILLEDQQTEEEQKTGN
jgi:cbb3-type cytochrome oxidase maturation protein